MALRLMIHDPSCTRTGPVPIGLTHAWRAGGPLYELLGRLDVFCGARSWDEALDWLAAVRPAEPIAEIQFWGHGRRGMAMIAGDRLDVRALGHRRSRRALERVRERLAPGALWWFRTCDTFGGEAGQNFASRWTEFFGCRAAGFTHIIGLWQSGLHLLAPGAPCHWSSAEGIRLGTPSEPRASAWSAPWRPHTITCFDNIIPPGW